MLDFTCPRCGQRLRVAEIAAGRKVKCPRCAAILDAPRLADGSLSGERTLPPSASERPNQPTSGVDPEFGSLLSPPQQSDEIGRLGPYRILKVLGVGGMGVVFESEDSQLKRPVALKAMLPSLLANASCRERFVLEAQAAARAGVIPNDHIVTVYQVGEANGTPFMAMQLLHGESLETRLRRVQRLSIDAVIRIGREIADGLEAAHSWGLVHRDIKPSNIWLEAGRDRVKILDFGLARATGDSHLTKSGVLIGTPSYMAPEQAGGGKSVSPRSDLFSLGCVLYRCCTGELPFKGNDTLAVLTALATVTPTRVDQLNPAVPPALADLIARLLAKDPADRPPSALAVLEALGNGGAVQIHAPLSAPAVAADDTVALELVELDEKRSRRRWAIAVACDLLVLALLISGLVLLARALHG